MARRDIIITEEHLRELVKAAPARAANPIWILPQTGMRPGELINVDHRQCDRAKSYIRLVRHKRLGIDSGWDRKTRDEVHVPIRRDLWKLFGPAKKEGWVFEGYGDDPKERVNQFDKDFRRARRRVAKRFPNWPEVKAHDCKHTYCTAFLDNDGNVKRLSEITGTSPETLLRVYAHLVNRAPISETARVNFGKALPVFPQFSKTTKSNSNAALGIPRREK